jgi:hypothetical protein
MSTGDVVTQGLQCSIMSNRLQPPAALASVTGAGSAPRVAAEKVKSIVAGGILENCTKIALSVFTQLSTYTSATADFHAMNDHMLRDIGLSSFELEQLVLPRNRWPRPTLRTCFEDPGLQSKRYRASAQSATSKTGVC